MRAYTPAHLRMRPLTEVEKQHRRVDLDGIRRIIFALHQPQHWSLVVVERAEGRERLIVVDSLGIDNAEYAIEVRYMSIGLPRYSYIRTAHRGPCCFGARSGRPAPRLCLRLETRYGAADALGHMALMSVAAVYSTNRQHQLRPLHYPERLHMGA